MKISIALATFNGEKYLMDQLNSILEQTIKPDQLIISDDCSSDNTVKVAREFSKTAPFEVKVYPSKKTKGFSQNFSRALSKCDGDIIFLSDQDDAWLPEKIEVISNYLDINPQIQLVIHDLEYCNEDLQPIGQTKMQRMLGNYDLERSYVVGMATALRGTFMQTCIPIPDRTDIGHDAWLHSCARMIGAKAIIPEVLALYRRHSDNVTGNGPLNVGYVTDNNHFKRNTSRAYLELKQKINLSLIESELNLDWLNDNYELILNGMYQSDKGLQDIISVVKFQNKNIADRIAILNSRRVHRILPILRLLSRGGYAQYNGFKSALKDALLIKV